MSDRMQPIPFPHLLNWVLTEWKDHGTVFGCHKAYRAAPAKAAPFLGRSLETAVGPAAGPHTQLAQNIAAGYLCGARMFELKTVQILDGEDLHVAKPCILAEDEGYNCEWSTELTVQQAFEEYVKAWFLLHLMAKELELGGQEGFVFNMSVGYDLAGIQSPKIDSFLEGLKDASGTAVFNACKAKLLDILPRCKHLTAADVEAISPHICTSVTVSTMHGCPADEIEKIARYLLEEKGLHLYLKCNPTLLGYDAVRQALDARGFRYIQFEHSSFDHDLSYEAAVPMLRRLQARAKELGQHFGVKLTNTFPVRVLRGELPDETMYMSGRTLLPLSLGVAAKLAADFDGALPMSYCGGADAKNIAAIRSAGLWPVTVCTDLLKPGGYDRLQAMAVNLEQASPAERADAQAIGELARTLCAPARETQELRRKPRPVAPDCHEACRRVVCGSCATLCPNRANVVVSVEGHKQMLHLDGPCNECGNCASFCPDGYAPYLEKLTVFRTEADLANSANSGFAPLADGRFAIRWKGRCGTFALEDLDAELAAVIRAVRASYPYLLYC